jgi:hypothetical protein
MRKLRLLVCLLLMSCVTVRHIEITPIESGEEVNTPISVESPVKAHLEDGSTVMFPKGVTVDAEMVKGQGFKYDITLQHSEPVTEIDLGDVAAMESYQDVVNTGATVAATTITTVGGGLAGIALLKAIFGSCPTTYSLENGEPILEAESFSYSIAPGFEARDVDRLGIESADQSTIELEMRNEALETHYINHVELLEIMHAQNESVYPDPTGQPIVIGELIAPTIVVDRSGRRIDHIVRAADSKAWSSAAERLRNVTPADMEDFIDVEFDLTASADQLALVLKLRNSLLNTVLLYDVMLKEQGFRALDWMGRDLDQLLPKYRLARWYQKKMGMRIAVWDGGKFTNVESIPDTGPIAWNEIAIPLPATRSDKLKVRLSFIADNWRIDQVALGTDVRIGKARNIPVAEVRSASGDELEEARSNLYAADDAYVITTPGEYFRLRFDTDHLRNDLERTWFLAAEGYYIEWMRKDWLETSSSEAFSPSDDALLSALELWEPQRDEFRERFEATRLSVR